MKKIDEIMELMADEMADFKTSLVKLETLTRELNEKSIPISTAAIDDNLRSFLQKQAETDEQKNELLRDINIRLEKASLIPNFILVLFGSILILLLIGLGYLMYSARIAQEEKSEVYSLISKSRNDDKQDFISEYPGS